MSVLRPRDIQARIRAGESPEAVAAAAQTTVEKIAGFVNPALAERAHIAQQARSASVRRRGGDGPPRHLGEAVTDRLQADGVRAEVVAWDDGEAARAAAEAEGIAIADLTKAKAWDGVKPTVS